MNAVAAAARSQTLEKKNWFQRKKKKVFYSVLKALLKYKYFKISLEKERATYGPLRFSTFYIRKYYFGMSLSLIFKSLQYRLG